MISEALMQNLSVKGLCDDSRRVKAQDLFFSMPRMAMKNLRAAPLLRVPLPW